MSKPNDRRDMTDFQNDIEHLSQELIELGRFLHRAVTRRDTPSVPGVEHESHVQRGGQWRVLGILHHHESQTMNDLASRMDVAPPTVTGIVRGLVERGLVERNHDPDDWRVVRITITDAGRETFAAHWRDRRAMMTRVLQELDDDAILRLRAAIPAFHALEQILDPAARQLQGEPSVARHT
jgi:DNA-binding MarR family transcriptional regulator